MKDPMKFFWGLFFAGLGILMLGVNLGLWTNEIWNQAWLLLPMILIVVGLRFIFDNDWVFIALATLVVLLTGYTIIERPATVINKIEGNRAATHQSLNGGGMQNINKANIKLDLGAAKIKIFALNTGQSLYSLDAKNLGKITTKQNVNNGEADLAISEEFIQGGFNSKFSKREIAIGLAKNIPLNLNLNSGASAIDIDLSALDISALNLNSGASSGRIRLGEHSLTANIDTGASKIEFEVPKNIGLKINFDKSGLNSQNFASGLGLSDRGANVYSTDNYDNANNKIELNISAGVSNIGIKQY